MTRDHSREALEPSAVVHGHALQRPAVLRVHADIAVNLVKPLDRRVQDRCGRGDPVQKDGTDVAVGGIRAAIRAPRFLNADLHVVRAGDVRDGASHRVPIGKPSVVLASIGKVPYCPER